MGWGVRAEPIPPSLGLQRGRMELRPRRGRGRPRPRLSVSGVLGLCRHRTKLRRTKRIRKRPRSQYPGRGAVGSLTLAAGTDDHADTTDTVRWSISTPKQLFLYEYVYMHPAAWGAVTSPHRVIAHEGDVLEIEQIPRTQRETSFEIRFLPFAPGAGSSYSFPRAKCHRSSELGKRVLHGSRVWRVTGSPGRGAGIQPTHQQLNLIFICLFLMGKCL